METPEQRKAFARHVLWHLAGLRADVYETKLMVVELLARERGVPAVTIQAQYAEESGEKMRRLYRQAMREAGLGDSPDIPE